MTTSLCLYAPRFWQQAVPWLIQVLFTNPLRGLTEILRGLNQAGQELLRAAISTAVIAVQKQLGGDGKVRVQQGLNQARAGAQELIPLGIVAVLLWSYWSPSILSLVIAAWVLAQLVCTTID